MSVTPEFSREAEKRLSFFRAADTRVGGSDIERLRWLLAFCSREPREVRRLSAQALTDLGTEAECFAIGGGYFPNFGREHSFSRRGRLLGTVEHRLTAADLAWLVEQSRSNIRNLLAGAAFVIQLGGGRKIWRALSSTFRETTGGDARSIFLMRTFDLVQAEGRRIAKCASCEKLFIRRKRGAYCTPSCSQRERTRRYRQKVGKKKLSDLRHDLYKAKVAKRRGEKIAIRVRRRKPWEK
jgi:hypothetical protein